MSCHISDFQDVTPTQSAGRYLDKCDVSVAVGVHDRRMFQKKISCKKFLVVCGVA